MPSKGSKKNELTLVISKRKSATTTITHLLRLPPLSTTRNRLTGDQPPLCIHWSISLRRHRFDGFSRSHRIQPESMLRHAGNQHAQCPTVVPVPERTPAKPVLSKSSNNFPGDGPLSQIWAMRASNKRQRCFGICKENQQSLTQNTHR